MLEQVKEYFRFSRKERFGILILLVLIVTVGVAPAFYGDPSKPSDSTMLAAFRDQLAMLDTPQGDSDAALKGSYQPGNENADRFRIRSERDTTSSMDPGSVVLRSEPFYFDPNTLDKEGWHRLGIREKTALTIEKYRSKGGKFRKPDDLLKIFGLSEIDKQRLLPYVRIVRQQETTVTRQQGTESPPVAAFGSPGEKLFRRQYAGKLPPEKIDINLADTTQWRRLPGIGSVLSQRIVKYRDRLGGFYSVQQVSEIYGLQDSVFQKILPWLSYSTPPVRVRLNHISVTDLERHLYFGRKLARAIVDYRDQHGPFRKADELGHLVLITPAILERLVPYIEL